MLDGKIAHRKNRTFCIVKPPKPDGFGGNSGIPTVRGYNAPCFEGMVHYCMGSVLIAPGQRGQEGQKQPVKFIPVSLLFSPVPEFPGGL